MWIYIFGLRGNFVWTFILEKNMNPLFFWGQFVVGAFNFAFKFEQVNMLENYIVYPEKGYNIHVKWNINLISA